MKTPSTSFERFAGATLILALSVGYFGLVRGRRDRVKHDVDVHLEVRAERIAGVVTGSEVRLRGVDVGTVKTVELGPPEEGAHPIHMTIAISPEAAKWLHADARALVHAPLYGAANLELLEGKDGTHDLKAPLEAELVPGIAEGVGKIVKDVHGFEGRVSTILANVETTTTHLKEVSADLHDPSKPLGAMVRDQAIADKLRGTLDDVRHLAADLRATGSAVASPTEGVPAALALTIKSARSVGDTTDAVRAETPKILARVDRVAEALERLVRTLHGSAELAPEAIASSIVVLDEARRTLEATQKNFLLRGNLAPKQGGSGLATPRAPRGDSTP